MKQWGGCVVVALGVLLAGCEAQTVSTEPDVTTDEGNDGTGGDQETRAQLGDAITLTGSDEGLEVRVTVMEVVDPAKSGEQFIKPGRGNRYVAVRVRIENVGSAVYDDTPSNGAAAIDEDDQQFPASLFDEVKPALGSPKIAPGDQRVGFITFEVSKDATLRRFQLTLDSGFGPETGEWDL